MSNGITELETVLRGLLKGEHSSLTIGFNDATAPNYLTAQQAFDEDAKGDDWFTSLKWVSEEERAKAIAGNSVWTCQWYPHTPIGSHTVAASSLRALVEALEGVPDVLP